MKIKKIIQISLWQILLTFIFAGASLAYICGEDFTVAAGANISGMCQCSAVNNQASPMTTNTYSSAKRYCCGYAQGDSCQAYEDLSEYVCGETNSSATIPDGASCNCDGGGWESYYDAWLHLSQGVCCGWVKDNKCLNVDPALTDAYCGDVYQKEEEKNCICGGSGAIIMADGKSICCGWLRDGVCQNTDVGINDLEVSSTTLSNLNPLSTSSGGDELSTPGGIISRALKSFVFPIAGLILFVVLLLGGFQMLTGAANSKGMEEGKQRITSAIIGFIILFAAYWIAQLLELIFGIRILS